MLADEGDVTQVQPFDEAHQAVAVETIGIDGVVGRLVRTAEAEQVGCHHPRARGGEDRDHAPVKVTPGRLAMKAEESLRGARRPLVEVMHAQAGESRQVLDVTGCEVSAGQSGETLVGCSQDVHGCPPRRCRPSAGDEQRWSCGPAAPGVNPTGGGWIRA